MLFFSWNSKKTFEVLELCKTKGNNTQHIHFYINNWGECFDDHAFCVFRIGWITCRDAFHVVLHL